MARVVHFEIHADEPERAVRFYSDLFGWVFSKWDAPIPYWLISTGPNDQPGINGGLLRRPCARPAEEQGINAFVCTVQVEAIDAVLERAATLKAPLALPKMPIPGVGWLAYLKDTEGNVFGVTQPDPAAR